MNKTSPRESCVYGQCKARNLCKGSHCVGRSLLTNESLLMENGMMRDATEAEKEQLLGPKTEGTQG